MEILIFLPAKGTSQKIEVLLSQFMTTLLALQGIDCYVWNKVVGNGIPYELSRNSFYIGNDAQCFLFCDFPIVEGITWVADAFSRIEQIAEAGMLMARPSMNSVF